MTSTTAVEELEQMKADGLDPTFDDVIRLNALGLKLEAAKKKHAATTSLDYLPRVAALSRDVALRQPTIGHEVWMSRVEQMCAADYETLLAVKAFALSRPADKLPDPEDPKAVIDCIEEFAKTFAPFTRDQIFAALEYVMFGASETAGEHPAAPPAPEEDEDERVPDGSEGEDWKLCLSLGVLIEGRVALWGMNQREVESMTRRQLEDAIRRSYIYHGIDVKDPADDYVAEFYATVDEIRTKLQKEAKK